MTVPEAMAEMKNHDFENIKRKDYSKIDSFQRIGKTWKKIAENAEYLVWSADTHPGLLNLEVWKKRWMTNPDGTKVLVSPSDESWGVWGWTLYYTEEVAKKKLRERFGIALS